MQFNIKDIVSFIANGLCVQIKSDNRCDVLYMEVSEETKSIFVDYFIKDLREKARKTVAGKSVVYGFDYDEDKFYFFNEDDEVDELARKMVKFNMTNVLEYLPNLENGVKYNLPPTLVAFEVIENGEDEYNYKFRDYVGWVNDEMDDFINELYNQ